MTLQIEIQGLDKVKEFLKTKNIEALKHTQDAITQSTIFLQGEVKESIAGNRAEPKSVDTGNFMRNTDFKVDGMEGI